MTRLYDLSRAEAQRILRERLRKALRAEADRLLRAAEQVRLMEYEVGLKLYERREEGLAAGDAGRGAAAGHQPRSPSASKTKYWNDELRDTGSR